MSVSYGGDSITFADGSTISSGWTGFKNKIINGAMVIDQRNGGSLANTNLSLSGVPNFGVDRFGEWHNGGGNTSFQQSSTAPTGFNKSVVFTVVNTDTPATTDYYLMHQYIEGYNIADLGWGTASAVPVTLSFWVRSSVTGTYSVCVRNADGTMCYPVTYTIDAQNTWEKKTITVPGPTSGTWNTTNGIGIGVWFCHGAGSTYSDTSGAWTTKQYTIAATGTNTTFMATAGATIYYTGIQLEKGSTASSFEWRPYGTELALCQRYLPAYIYSSASGMETIAWVRGGSTSSIATAQIPFQVTPRVPPTGLTVVGTFAVSGLAFSGVAFAAASQQAGGIGLSGGSSMTVYYMYELQCSTAGSKLLWTGCEL